jgi:HlyD family secretion protein
VAASFQVATLFTLAEDLKQMELEVDVAEADVGQVREGQLATFSVDAYGNRKYEARIRRVSYGSQTTSGVVTYKAVLTVSNDDLTLRPGMTATAEITTIEHEDVLLVPNAALRFTPPSAAAPAQQGSIVSRLLPRPPRFASRANANRGKNGKSGTGEVYVLKDGMPVAVPVTVGPSNGRLTEVTSSELSAGTPLITETVGAAVS